MFRFFLLHSRTKLTCELCSLTDRLTHKNIFDKTFKTLKSSKVCVKKKGLNMSLNGVTECIQIPVFQGQFIVDKKVYDDPDIKTKMAILLVCRAFFPLHMLLVFSIMTAGPFILNIPNIRMTWSHYPPRQITTSCVTYKKKHGVVQERKNCWRGKQRLKNKFFERKKRGDSFSCGTKEPVTTVLIVLAKKKKWFGCCSLSNGFWRGHTAQRMKKKTEIFQNKFVPEHNNEHPGHHFDGRAMQHRVWPVSSLHWWSNK